MAPTRERIAVGIIAQSDSAVETSSSTDLLLERGKRRAATVAGKKALLSFLLLGTCPAFGQEDAATGVTTVAESLTTGDVAVNIRLRHEYAHREGLDSSEATTIRTRLGYGTKPIKGIHGFVEFEDVSALVKYAGYNADSDQDGPAAADTERLWMSVDISF